MSWHGIVRWGGLALLVGGLLEAIGIAVGSFQGPTDPLMGPTAIVQLVGIVLTLVSIPVLYLHLARAIRGWGLAGYVLLFSAGVLLGVGGAVLGLLGPALMTTPGALNGPPPPVINNYFMIGGIIELIGGVVFGAAIVLARIPERYAGALLILGTIISFLGNIFPVPHLGDLGTVLLVLALAWMGGILATRHAAEVEPSMAPADELRGARARA